MRVRGTELRDSGAVAVWWVSTDEQRAVLHLSSAQRVDLVQRLLDRVAGAAAHEESVCVGVCLATEQKCGSSVRPYGGH